jgi:ribonucleoside-triphosphate reductase
VYERTYSRVKADGSKETWPETVKRVVDGNLALVDEKFQLDFERQDLFDMMLDFKILPAGRHLWASGVTNAQHLFNCWVAGWTDRPSEHFEFTFMRLMEGGGVGASYSNSNLTQYPPIQHFLSVEKIGRASCRERVS